MTRSYSTVGEMEELRNRIRAQVGQAMQDTQQAPAPSIMQRPASTAPATQAPTEDPVAQSVVADVTRKMLDSADDRNAVENAILSKPKMTMNPTTVDNMETLKPLNEVLGMTQTDLAFSPAASMPESIMEAPVSSTSLGFDSQAEPESTSPSLPSNIDFDFIAEQEGDESSMYVPMSNGRAMDSSGPTIGMGVDLGQKSPEELEGLPEDLRRKLEPYTNLRGQAAVDFVRNNPLTLTDEERQIINAWSKQEETNRVIALWERDSDIPWEDLTTQQATAVASVMYQYGSYRVRTPNFWRAATSGNWDAVESELRNFGDKYGPRRVREANYLSGN